MLLGREIRGNIAIPDRDPKSRRCDKKSVANRAQRMSRWLSPGLFSSLAHPFQQFGRSGDAGIEWHALWAVENHFIIAALHSIEDPLS